MMNSCICGNLYEITGKLEESRLAGITTDSGLNVKAACEILGWV